MDVTLDDFIKTRKIRYPGRGRGQLRGGRGQVRGGRGQSRGGRGQFRGNNSNRGFKFQRGFVQKRGFSQQGGFVQRKGFSQRGGFVQRGFRSRGFVQRGSFSGGYQRGFKSRGLFQRNQGFGRGFNGGFKFQSRGFSSRGSFGVRGGGIQKTFVRTQQQNAITKLYISNLDFGVTNQDIKELFAEFGQFRRFGVNFDANGKANGTAEVQYLNKASAVRAVQKYNNVTLDGRPMKLEIAGGMPESAQKRVGAANKFNTQQFSNQRRGTFRPTRGFVQKRGAALKVLANAKNFARGKKGTRGNMRGRGAFRGKNQKPATAEQLDADLDAYSSRKD